MDQAIKVRPGAAKRAENIEKQLSDLNIEKKLLALRNTINNEIVQSARKFGRMSPSNQILVLGREELNLLYAAHELDIESGFKIDFNDKGFIDRIWSMDLYINDVECFVGVFDKADNIMFKE